MSNLRKFFAKELEEELSAAEAQWKRRVEDLERQVADLTDRLRLANERSIDAASRLAAAQQAQKAKPYVAKYPSYSWDHKKPVTASADENLQDAWDRVFGDKKGEK